MCRWLSCLVVLACAAPLFAQGALSRTREQVRGQPDPPKPPAAAQPAAPEKDNIDSWLADQDTEDLGYLAVGAAILAASPFWLPYLLLQDNLFNPTCFPGHPYAADYIRFLEPGPVRSQNNDRSLFDPERFKPWSLRLAVEDGHDFDRLNRLGGRLAFDTSCRFGLTTNWNYLHEQVPGGPGDDAVLGDVNLTFRFAQANWVQLHAGLGARLLSDRQMTRAGFNFLYSADFFPIDPLVLSAQVDLGNLGSAFVIHARGTAGWQIGRFELFGGYDFLRIGSVNIQGPLAGVRLWF